MGFVPILADQHKFGLLKSVRGLAIILLVMYSRSVGIAVSNLLLLLIEVCSVELLCLSALAKSAVSSKHLLVWTEARVQVWLRPKAQQGHWQPVRPLFVVLAVPGNGIFEHTMPAFCYTIGFRMIGWRGLTVNCEYLALLAPIGGCKLRSSVGKQQGRYSKSVN